MRTEGYTIHRVNYSGAYPQRNVVDFHMSLPSHDVLVLPTPIGVLLPAQRRRTLFSYIFLFSYPLRAPYPPTV